jgi:hypothetical protein
MNLSQELAENHRSLASLDERIYHAELRRDFPPPGSHRSDPIIQEELRLLYIGHAKLLQHIQQLEKDLLELNFSKTFRSVLETAQMPGGHAASG